MIAGAGIAGLSAALEACQIGAKVIILEKLKAARGNTHYAGGGGLNKITGSLEEVLHVASETGKGGVDLELIKTYAQSVNESIDWLSSLGVEWYESVPISGQHTNLRKINKSYKRVKGHGAAICRVLTSAVSKKGIDIWYQTRANEIMTDKKGKITGLTARQGEKKIEIETRSIVLASGGFQGNRNMMKQYINPSILKAKYSGSPFNTGDGHLMASKFGAQLINMNQWHGSLRNKHRINPYPRLQYGSILVNSQGTRFVDEIGHTKDYIAKALVHQEIPRGFIIFDENIKREFKDSFEEHLVEYPAKGIPPIRKTDLAEIEESLLEDKTLIKASTFQELSEKIEIPYGRLEQTITEYNAAIDQNKIQNLEVPRKNYAYMIDTPPFYAQEVRGTINCTLGGIKINSNAQVINEDNQPIPGLYAAGEIIGGFYYDNYQVITGYLSPCLVFGRIAGIHAAKEALLLAAF